MSNKKSVFIFPPREKEYSDDGRKSSGESRAPRPILTGDMTSSREELYVDDHIAWNVEHQMRRTAGKQAGYLVQVRRQAEVDLARVEQAMWLRVKAIALAAEWIDLSQQLAESYAHNPTELAKRVRAMVDEAADDFVRLPRAGMSQFLSRYF